MAPVIPDPKKIKSFRTEAAFETWLAANHDRETELWLKIHKKDSGVPTVTPAQALDVALCWGWIDGIRKAFDERSFLQRYTPRTGEEHLEPDQPRQRRPADRGRPHDRRTASGRSTPRRPMAAGTPPTRRSAARPKPPSPTTFAPPSRRTRGRARRSGRSDA